MAVSARTRKGSTATRDIVILGVDAGTTSVKTVAFSPDGGIRSLARSTLHVQHGEHGEAELDMTRVWEATAATINAVVEQLGEAEVVGIGITGQGDGMWLVDQHGAPIAPAALWMDGRADARVERWERDGRSDAVQAITGSRPFAGAFPLLADELLDVDSCIMEQARHHLNCKDWLGYKMTGVIATDPTEASRTYLDLASGKYSEELLFRLGHERLRDMLPPVREPGAVLGRLHESAARELRLSPGIPVILGQVDVVASGTGLAVLDNDEGYLILGTTGVVAVNRADSAQTNSRQSLVVRTGRGSQVLEALAPMTGTPNLDWVRATLGMAEIPWPTIEHRASAVPPGSGGLLYLPYGSPSGERAPFNDSSASAAWLGMSVRTTSAELLRSVYEGLSFSLAECVEALGLSGPLTICGGGSESDLFCSILADVLGTTIHRQNVPEVGARGVAVLAAAAVGVFDDLGAAMESMTPMTEAFEPDADRQERYRAFYSTFTAVRDALRPTWPSLRVLRHMGPL